MMHEEKPLSELTNEELLAEAGKKNTTAIVNALLIGFLIGIVAFSVIKNSLGLLALIPLLMAYRLSKKTTARARQLDALLKERNLK